MSEATSDAFLSGQGIPVELAKIPGALADLWGPAAEREGGPEVQHPAVTRVSLANLVVADLGGESSRTDDVLDTVVARSPCRAIVIHRHDGIGRGITAEISALCHLPAPGRPQVCSERIGLRVDGDGFDLIPGAVRPLLEADLPLVVWWIGDPRAALPLFRELAAEASRLVLDLPDPEAEADAVRAALDQASSPYGRDLAWFGATRWRELTAQFFDPPGREATLHRIKAVTIVAETATPGPPPRVAAWLAAWLAGQLGWSPRSRAQPAPGKEIWTFAGPSGEIAVTCWAEAHARSSPAQIARVSITLAGDGGHGDVTFRLTRLGEQVAVEVVGPSAMALPRMIHSPELTVPDRVSAALESAREAPPYRKALPTLLWLRGGAGA